MTVTGCASSGDTQVDPDADGRATQSAAPGPTAEPSAPGPSYAVPSSWPSTEADYPADAKGTDADSALYALGVYLDMVNYAYATPDAQPLREFSDPACGTCQRWIIETQQNADAGIRQVGGNVILQDVVLVDGTPGGGTEQPRFVFDTTLLREAGQRVGPDGVIEELPEGVQKVSIAMAYVPATFSEVLGREVFARWVVSAVDEPVESQ